MNTRSILFSMIFASITFTLFAACGGGNKEEASKEQEAAAGQEQATPVAEGTAPQFTVDTAFQRQLAAVFQAYILLKDAFVSSDAAKVKASTATVQEALGKTDMKLLSGAAHHDWMSYLGGMEASLKNMQGSNDLEAQRKAFSDLSGNLYKSIKAYGLDGKTAYYDFCPMAFNNQGGYWISDQDAIRNPYFGDEMLTCGEVIEELK